MNIFIFFILSFGPSAYASYSGTLKSSTDIYPAHLGEPTDDVVPYLILDANGKNKISKKLRFQWHLYGLSNPESDYAPEKLYADLPEANLEWKASSSLRFRAGMNTVNWGVTDLSSPSDVVNPSAFFHPLRIIKRGSPMIEADYDREIVRVHAIYIPRQQKSLLPSEDSRWLPRKFLLNVNTDYGRIGLPDFFEYEIGKDEVLTNGSKHYTLSNNALDHNAGLRLSSHLGSLDLYAMHFEGAAPQPKVRPDITIVSQGSGFEAQSPIRLRPLFYRVRTTSGGFVLAREKWIFRAESAYQHTISEDPLLQPWSWASVAAIETNLDIGSSSMIILLQYYYTVNPQAADNMISSSYRLFDRTAVIGSRWSLSEKWTITMSLLYESVDKGLFALAGFENKLSDSLRWGLSWRDFSAQEDGLLKTYDKNDHANLELTYYF